MLRPIRKEEALSDEAFQSIVQQMERDKSVHKYSVIPFIKHFAYLANRFYFTEPQLLEAARYHDVDPVSISTQLIHLESQRILQRGGSIAHGVYYRMAGASRVKYEAELTASRTPAPAPVPEKLVPDAALVEAATSNWKRAPRTPGELKSFVKEVLAHFNVLRKKQEQTEVGAYVATLEDCGAWACVFAEKESPDVYVLPVQDSGEMFSCQSNRAAERQTRRELAASFTENAKSLDQNPSPKELAERIWRQSTPAAGQKGMAMPDARNVFVIHGRNGPARDAMFDFLRALGLNPIEWGEAIRMTGKGAPYIGEILDAAFGNAQAVVAVLTGDDLAYLREEFQQPHDPESEKKPTPQARPNVLFEAGMAFGRHPERTIMVQLGYLRPFSDVAGRHAVQFSDTPESRTELRERLKTAKCAVKEGGTDWLKSGNFKEAIRLAHVLTAV